MRYLKLTISQGSMRNEINYILYKRFRLSHYLLQGDLVTISTVKEQVYNSLCKT